MTFQLDEIVPWGRSYYEYVQMFSLTNDDLDKKILGCSDGPASFNSVMCSQGKTVVSVDPLYRYSADQIRLRIQQVYPTILEQLLSNQSAYVWTTIKSPQDLVRIRMEAMQAFLKDYDRGKNEGRYLPYELPQLPFGEGKFDLALCSHFLFTYHEQLSVEFHCHAVLEMCRVAKELRVFPFLDMGGQLSSHLEPVCKCLKDKGYRYTIQSVDYEFQCGANQMLKVWKE